MTAVTLHYELIPAASNQSARPLVILHGLFGSQSNWKTVARRLAQYRDVYVPDCRNHGTSPHHTDMSYQQMANDLHQLQQQLSLDCWHVLGHSMGGKTVMRYAYDHPENLDRLIVIDIAPKAYPPRHHEIFAAIDRLADHEVKSRNAAGKMIEDLIPDQATRLFLLTNLERGDNDNLIWRFNEKAIKAAYQSISANPLPDTDNADFHAIDTPTLFIKGAESGYIKTQDSDLLKQYFPNSQLHVIQQAGHWLHAQQPEQLLQQVNTFLDTDA